jgi:hypothetical protein
LLIPDTAGKITDEGGGLEQRIDILRRKTGGKRENHHSAAEKAEFADDALSSEFIGERTEGAEDRLPRKGGAG